MQAIQETWVQSLGWEESLKRKWQHTPVFLLGEFHGQKSLAGYSSWGLKELDTTEQVSLYLLTIVNNAAMNIVVQVHI